MDFENILNRVEAILNSNDFAFDKKLSKICQLLKNEISYYDWVGFYFAEQSTKTLHLGPYVGEPTDHKIIPFGKGICGQVAESNSTFVVEDVNAQDNYIACSITVKSEIVVPLFANNLNVGQIDIDSNTKNAFGESDKKLLTEINQLISKVIVNDNVDLKKIWI